jgi:glutaredoxin 3
MTINETHGASISMTQHSTITMYTTEVCPYCLRAKALLKARGVTEIDEIRVDRDPTARTAMIERTGRRTVPQIFIGDAHIGGCDDLMALDQRGDLLPLLQPQPAPD